ncbi:beta-N-acetylglucosaminidase domain-containing protein [Salicola sp. Rm-C-2C1-2]|uniref:beta-N-acetylglucosaminidase domain-containing protein n=1 Tax=Salicola sp. Rm-C-2C1-2 TaxID=3141321 RepID=UPI0032E4303D
MLPPLGIIEGFYGPVWSWSTRRRVMERLSYHGYGFYIYAPKGDPLLREQWFEPVSEKTQAAMAEFASACRMQGVRFGVGLSPLGALASFDDIIRQALLHRLQFLDGIGVQDLVIQFDDALADLPELAARQVELVHWVRAHCAAERIIVCPSYYSDDPMLDALFGRRPAGYLETLGALLDSSIEIAWAGEEICARQWSSGHLERVADQLQRRPFLWDNYPVNDSSALADHLHLRGFTGRPAAIAPLCSAHAINPALQPTLSCIPALTLADSYHQGNAYQYMESTLAAMVEVLGESLAAQMFADLPVLQDAGRHSASRDKQRLRDIYALWDHPAAREVVAWLDGSACSGPGP